MAITKKLPTEFLTYRATRIVISALIFFATFYIVEMIHVIDRALNEPLLYLNRTISHFYTRIRPISAPMTEHLRIVDLALEDSTKTKQACASLIDSLKKFGAPGIVVDIHFSFRDTTGMGALLRGAKCDSGNDSTIVVFGFDLTSKEKAPDNFINLTRAARHTVTYSPSAKKEYVQRWEAHDLNHVDLPVDNLTETATLMGCFQFFKDSHGRVEHYYYPLFQRLSQDGLLFAGLATQAFRVWRESPVNCDSVAPWSLEQFLEELAANNIDWDPKDGTAPIYRITSIQTNYVIPTWQNVLDDNRDISLKRTEFAGKMILIVNSPTEPKIEKDAYPLWGYQASVISQLIDPSTVPNLDLIAIPFLLISYAAWVYARLWPSRFNNRITHRRSRAWLIMAASLYLLPLVLPGANVIRRDPIPVALLLGIALFTFEAVDRIIRRPREINFEDLHFVLNEPEAGAARVSILQAPVRLDKYAAYDLPADQAKPWRHHQRPSYISDLPEMRALGESLYDFIMAGKVGSVFEASLEKAVSENKILRLRIRNESASFDGLPFEMLRDAVKGYGYLALHDHLSIMRDLAADPTPELHWTLPLRLLVLMASPVGQGYQRIDVETEKSKILHGTRLLQRQGWLQLKMIDHATHAILEDLPASSFDVIHFAGHGTIDRTTESNCLVFEGPNGEPDEIDADHFGQRVRHIGPKLILLNACSTGAGTEKGVFINIGRELQRTTGAVIIAHQYFISETGGNVFSDAFYKTFAETLSPELALNRARQSIARNLETVPSDWVSPVYFIR